MLTIITDKKTYYWNYKRFLKNLYYVLALIVFIVAFLIVSYMDYLTLTK